jgi:hypothetical protein
VAEVAAAGSSTSGPAPAAPAARGAVLLALGTRGDVQPLAALAERLCSDRVVDTVRRSSERTL